jgi:hypothetical protein
MFALTGLLLIVLSWVAGLYLLVTWKGQHTMSISQHAASAKGASRLFMITLILGGAGLYFWLITWFVPKLDLPRLFTVLVTLTVIAQFIAAIVPDTDAWKSKLHRFAAYTMAALYLPLSWYILNSHSLSIVSRLIGGICLLYMIIASILFLTVKRARNRYLIFQSLYIIAFQLIILSAAYLPPV